MDLRALPSSDLMPNTIFLLANLHYMYDSSTTAKIQDKLKMGIRKKNNESDLYREMQSDLPVGIFVK